MTEHNLIEKVRHGDFKKFAKKQMAQKGLYSSIHGISILLTGFTLSAASGYGVSMLFLGEGGSFLIQIIPGLLFSFTLLIVIHELLHGLAYKLVGAKRVYFGAILSKFIFYAGSDQEVFNGNQYRFIALFPFLCITVAVLLGLLIWPEYFLFSFTVLFIHTLFCGGDFAILNFIHRYDLRQIHTLDSREKEETYYYLKNEVH